METKKEDAKETKEDLPEKEPPKKIFRFYGVVVGKQKEVFGTWGEVNRLIELHRPINVSYKGCDTMEEAEKFITSFERPSKFGRPVAQYPEYDSGAPVGGPESELEPTTEEEESVAETKTTEESTPLWG
ncbi:hypothetical protein V8F33_007015 [Rhypophila sp. PSN 637]